MLFLAQYELVLDDARHVCKVRDVHAGWEPKRLRSSWADFREEETKPCMEIHQPCVLDKPPCSSSPCYLRSTVRVCSPKTGFSGAHRFISRMESGESWNLETFRIKTNSHTDWDPNQVKVALQVELDACFVPTHASPPGVRADTASIVVIDGLVDDAVRRELLSLLVTDEMSPFPPAELWEHSTVDDASAPRPTWGLRKHVLDCLKSAAPLMEVHTRLQKLYPELSFFHMPSEHMTLNREDKNVPLGHTLKTGCGTSTYSERVGHPSNAGTNREQFPHGMRRAGRTSSVDAICTDHNHQMQQVARQLSYQQQPRRQQGRPSKRQCIPTEQVAATDQPQGGQGGTVRGDKHANLRGFPGDAECNCFVGNAAVHGDRFQWHVDADPMAIPPESAWGQQFGMFANREPGCPRLMSMLVYLNSTWPLGFDAESLFLDTASDTGVAVLPKPGRVVLMDQDILHRVSQPSAAAGRPRYSLVWKLLAMCPKSSPEQRKRTPSVLLGQERGAVTAFGSAMQLKLAQAAELTRWCKHSKS